MLESLFNKVASFQACNFVKKILQLRPFPVNIAKFLETAVLLEHQPISYHWDLPIPPENSRKPLLFRFVKGVQIDR